jgi:membrane dipeptidase
MRILDAAVLLACLTAATSAPLGAEDDALRRVRKLLDSHILIDGHNDLPWAIREAAGAPLDVAAYDLRRHMAGQTDLPRLAEGRVGGQFFSVYVPGEEEARKQGYARLQLEEIDIARRMIARYPDRLALALTADEAVGAWRSGRIASFLGMEGGHVLENSLGALRAYYDLGVRYMTLTHNVTLDWADSTNDEARHHGLTRFGEEVVREMNRLGMLVDLSHTSPETMDDALRVSEAPVIFSHSSCRAVCDVARNVPEDILRRLPENGGVIMVTFVPEFVSAEYARIAKPGWEEVKRRTRGVTDPAERTRIRREVMGALPLPRVTVAQVADHVEHARRVAGIDHVGLGSDFDGASRFPEGLEDVSRFPNLLAELARRGWSDEDLAKLAADNVLRVLRRAEEVARRLQGLREPSIATIESLDPPTAGPP